MLKMITCPRCHATIKAPMDRREVKCEYCDSVFINTEWVEKPPMSDNEFELKKLEMEQKERDKNSKDMLKILVVLAIIGIVAFVLEYVFGISF